MTADVWWSLATVLRYTAAPRVTPLASGVTQLPQIGDYVVYACYAGMHVHGRPRTNDKDVVGIPKF